MTRPQQIKIAGVQLRCKHCDHDQFSEGEYLLGTFRGAVSPPRYRHLEPRARVLVCVKCGFLHWFVGGVGEDPERERDVDCLSCGARILNEGATCGECGWTYRGDESARKG